MQKMISLCVGLLLLANITLLAMEEGEMGATLLLVKGSEDMVARAQGDLDQFLEDGGEGNAQSTVTALLAKKEEKKLLLQTQWDILKEFEEAIRQVGLQIKEMDQEALTQESSKKFNVTVYQGLDAFIKKLQEKEVSEKVDPTDKELLKKSQVDREAMKKRMEGAEAILQALKGQLDFLKELKIEKKKTLNELLEKLEDLQGRYNKNTEKVAKIDALIVKIGSTVEGVVSEEVFEESRKNVEPEEEEGWCTLL